MQQHPENVEFLNELIVARQKGKKPPVCTGTRKNELTLYTKRKETRIVKTNYEISERSRINNQLQNDTISITIFMHNVQLSKALPIFHM